MWYTAPQLVKGHSNVCKEYYEMFVRLRAIQPVFSKNSTIALDTVHLNSTSQPLQLLDWNALFKMIALVQNTGLCLRTKQ